MLHIQVLLQLLHMYGLKSCMLRWTFWFFFFKLEQTSNINKYLFFIFFYWDGKKSSPYLFASQHWYPSASTRSAIQSQCTTKPFSIHCSTSKVTLFECSVRYTSDTSLHGPNLFYSQEKVNPISPTNHNTKSTSKPNQTFLWKLIKMPTYLSQLKERIGIGISYDCQSIQLMP